MYIIEGHQKAFANPTLCDWLKSLRRASFSTNEKQNLNQSQLVRSIFPRIEQVTGNCKVILIGSSRCLCLLWLVGVITLVLVFRRSWKLLKRWQLQTFRLTRSGNASKQIVTDVSLLDISDYRSNFPLLLTSPLMVPEPMRSPGRTLHPVTVWWTNCCFAVQYIFWKHKTKQTRKHKFNSSVTGSKISRHFLGKSEVRKTWANSMATCSHAISRALRQLQEKKLTEKQAVVPSIHWPGDCDFSKKY